MSLELDVRFRKDLEGRGDLKTCSCGRPGVWIVKHNGGPQNHNYRLCWKHLNAWADLIKKWYRKNGRSGKQG